MRVTRHSRSMLVRNDGIQVSFMVLTMRDYMPGKKLPSVLRAGVALDCSMWIMWLTLPPIHSRLLHLEEFVILYDHGHDT